MNQDSFTEDFPEKMSQESGTARFLAPSPSDIDIQNPNKRSRISYTREFLLSLAKADGKEKLARKIQMSIPCVFEDTSGLLSPPFCFPGSIFHESVPQNSSVKILDNANHQLHRSNEPYRPPCRYKALPPSSREGNDLLKSDTSGYSEQTNQEKAEREKWRKDTVKLPKEMWCSSKNTDSQESSEVFLMSPATRDSKNLHSTSNVIVKQSDASQKPSLIDGAVRGEAVQPSILPETIKNSSTQRQQMQDSIINETLNLWQKSVDHIDTSLNIVSIMDDGMHLMESEAYSNFDVGHPEGTLSVMEYGPPSFLSHENWRNIKKNLCQAEYEKCIMDLHLTSTSACAHGSPGRIAKRDHIDEKQLVSMADNCESATVHCEGILSLQGANQAISVSMMQNPSSPGFQIQQELKLNSFNSSLDGKSDSSFELCLPDEDSLITFDGPFLVSDAENSIVINDSVPRPERNIIEADVFSDFSPSSHRDMIEKLVESILNDESGPVPHLDDPMVYHGVELDGFCYSLHAQQSYTELCSNQLNPGTDQPHNSFQRNSIDSPIYSLVNSGTFPSNTSSQPFPLSHDELRRFHDELRRFDHEVSQSMLQQMINPCKLHLCSLCVAQSGVAPHLPTLQMASSTQKLNSMQGCLGYQEPNYEDLIRPTPDSHGDSNINQAVLDSLFDMKLQARHWHPFVGGF